MKKSKIKVESHGVTPWHDCLQNMSWGFSRGSSQAVEGIAYLNVDEKLANGGQGLKQVLMADFLNTLSFMPTAFLNEIFQNAASGALTPPQVENSAEVHGNTGYYYLPYEDEKGIRLDEPDGWIADDETLFLLEARGYRSPGVFNPGQLAKQFLIAEDVAGHTGRKNFYIVLIAEDFKNIYKSGKEKYSLSADSADGFEELWAANVRDLDAASGEALSEKMKLKDWKKRLAGSNAAGHFMWITWSKIREIVSSMKKDPKGAQIAAAIDFHSGVSKVMPIFSQLLFALAARQEPLYHFYNGGCGNATVRKYEKMFLKEIGESNSERAEYWTAWHELANHHRELLNNLTALEEARRSAIADGDEGADTLKDVQKQIKEFYRNCVDGISPRNTTRKAFELVGESSQLNDFSEFFIQRSKVEKVNSQTQEEEKMNDKKSNTVKETVAEMIKRIVAENDYEDIHLPATDLRGEAVSVSLVYNGTWTASFIAVFNKPAYFAYVNDDEEIDCDNTVWGEFDTPEEALEALDEQCKEMKARNAILVSDEQVNGDGYDKDEDENDDNECDDDHENDEDIDTLKNDLIELLKEQEPALQKLETIEMENDLELKSMIGKLPDNWEEMSSEEKLDTVFRKFELLNDSDMYDLALRGGTDWCGFSAWLDVGTDEDHQFTEKGACFALTVPCAEEEFDFNKFPEYLHPIIKEKCDDDYNILCTQSDSGTFAEAAESMYFMLDLLAYGYELTEREWFYKKHPDLYPDYDDDDDDYDDDYDDENEEEE